ncbi:MAG: hypothetical protein HYV26_08400 [Candidatus Hydrogenedentes bacterium]|nr:hypothetical protein [Candidatus Hydrogenedentota bacterium]MBI3117467.1 hypothetical protein [Candidatus Hydrogenedentota bacterium]
MNQKDMEAFHAEYVEGLRRKDPRLADRFCTLPRLAQRRWIRLMSVYDIGPEESTRALEEYLKLTPSPQEGGEPPSSKAPPP